MGVRDQPSGAVVFAVLAAATSEPAPPPRPPPPPPPPLPPLPPPIVWPGAGAVSGGFGEKRTTHRHMGLDLRAATGAPVVAAAEGTVVHGGPAPSGYGGYGTIVLIDHGGGVVTMYAHLARANVRRGQVVAPGDLVGGAGSTGQVTSPHLHFEVRRNGVPTDPQRWLPPRQGTTTRGR